MNKTTQTSIHNWTQTQVFNKNQDKQKLFASKIDINFPKNKTYPIFNTQWGMKILTARSNSRSKLDSH